MLSASEAYEQTIVANQQYVFAQIQKSIANCKFSTTFYKDHITNAIRQNLESIGYDVSDVSNEQVMVSWGNPNLKIKYQ